MTITTKFDINQMVWFVCGKNRKIKCEKVNGFKLLVQSIPVFKTGANKSIRRTNDYEALPYLVYYELETADNEPEFVLYATKEELLKSISQ